ncbi:unnamed protein product [Camellia sinensis]
MQIEQAASFPYRKPPTETTSAQFPDKNTVTEPLRGSSILSKFSVTPPMKTLDNQNNGSKRAEKEAKMKANEAKFSGSVERQDSAFSARRCAERLKSFNTQSTLIREQ